MSALNNYALTTSRQNNRGRALLVQLLKYFIFNDEILNLPIVDTYNCQVSPSTNLSWSSM